MKVLLIALVIAQASAGNPLSTVLELMDELTAKLIKDGDEEQKAFVKFTEWCDDATKNFGFEIETLTSRKNKLEAKIAEESSTIDACTAKIEELAANIATDSKDLKDATDVRNKEVAEFEAAQSELVDTVDTLSRAIGILEREMAKNPAAFTQVDVSSIDSLLKGLDAVVEAASFTIADKQKITSLVQAQQGNDDPGAPDPAAYKSHSTNILDVLEDMKEKAEEQLATLRKEETNTKHNFNLLKQSLEDQIAADTKEKGEETDAKSAAAESKATAEEDLAATNKDLAETKNNLADTNSDCMSVAADHDATVAGRKEELKVIATAKKILSGTTSGAVDQTYSMLQVASRLRTRSDLAGAEVVTALKQLAKTHNSEDLAQLASHVAAVLQYGASAGEDPFIKIKGLIKAMIAKLTKTMNAEADEKAWCDEQMAKTEERQTELEDDVAKLTAKIDQESAASATLKDEVAALQGELAALAKLQAQMDKIRAEEHATYVDAKADLELGLTGVRKALGVLRDYYGGAASGASMLQDGIMQPAKPELHAKSSGAGGSIIDILEVCESDFAKNLAQEEATESDALAEYEKVTQENAVTKTTKVQDVKYKTQEFIGLDKSIAQNKGDRKSTQSELDAVNDYYDKVKGKCIAKPETYEERKKKRAAEIAGLKEALSILENEVAFTQKRNHRFLGQ